MAKRTRLVLNATGPYRFLGEPVVQAPALMFADRTCDDLISNDVICHNNLWHGIL